MQSHRPSGARNAWRLTIVSTLCLSISGIGTRAGTADTPQNHEADPRTKTAAAEDKQAAGGTFTLLQAKRIALRDNPGIAAAQARVDQAAAVYRASKAPYLPVVTLSAAAHHAEDIPTDTVGIENVGSIRTYATSATAQWLVFDGFSRRFNLLAATYGRAEAAEALKDAQRLLLEAVGIAYYQALLAQENTRISRQDADFNQELSVETQKRFDAGAAARSDVLNFKIRTAQAESSYLVSTTGYTTATIALAALLGIPTGQLPAAMRPINRLEDPVSIPLPELEAEIDYAIEHRPDYQQATCAIARLQSQAEAVKGDFWPAVGIEAAYGWSRQDNFRFNDGRDANSYIGISATWEIFSGGLTTAAYSAAMAELRQSRQQRQQLRNEIVAGISRQIEATDLAKKQVDLQRRIHAMTSEARNLVRSEYLAGQTSLTRLNEAQTDLIRAAGNLAVATIRYWQERQRLAAASGRILELGE